MTIPSGSVVIEFPPMTSVAPEICCPVYRSVTRIATSGLAHNLGTVKVKIASATGTAKSEILNGHETRPQSRSLVHWSRTVRKGGEPDWARPAARPNRTVETLDCIQLPWRGRRDCADYPAGDSSISGMRRRRNRSGSAVAPIECNTWPGALLRVGWGKPGRSILFSTVPVEVQGSGRVCAQSGVDDG